MTLKRASGPRRGCAAIVICRGSAVCVFRRTLRGLRGSRRCKAGIDHCLRFRHVTRGRFFLIVEESAFDRRQCQRRIVRNALCVRYGLGVKVRAGNHTVHETQPERLVSAEPSTRQKQIAGAHETHRHDRIAVCLRVRSQAQACPPALRIPHYQNRTGCRSSSRSPARRQYSSRESSRRSAS